MSRPSSADTAARVAPAADPPPVPYQSQQAGKGAIRAARAPETIDENELHAVATGPARPGTGGDSDTT